MLTFPRTSVLLGAVPRLSAVFADTIGCLNARDTAKLHRRIQKLKQRFPQLVLQIVMHRFPEEHPLSLYSFWLFNSAAFFSGLDRGLKNRGLLIVIDPFRQESSIVPGYGLEPLLKQESLDHLLEMSNPAFGDGKWLVGLEALLDGVEVLLESVSSERAAVIYAEGEY
jgi:uncharacterized membrane protein YgcG